MISEHSFLMIGKQGSGKTSFLAAAYGIMSRGINGFKLKAANSNDSLQLDRMFSDLRNGEYPMATNKRITYGFDLTYTGRTSYLKNTFGGIIDFSNVLNNIFDRVLREIVDYPIAHFKWKDFYGGIMATKNIDEAASLKNEMKNSSGLMVFFDASELMQSKLAYDVHKTIKLISQNINGIESRFLLNIIVTKCDLVSSKDSFKYITEALTPILNIAKYNPHIVLCVNKVSCSQYGFVNIESPVLQLADYVLDLEIDNNKKQRDEENRLAKSAENEAGIFDDITSFLFSETSWRDYAATHRENEAEFSLTISFLENLKSKLTEYISKIPNGIYA